MIIKNLTQIGSPIIHAKSKVVRDVTSRETRKVVRDLVDSMRHHELVGIAAPQIGIRQRIFVTEVRKTLTQNAGADPLRVFINPRIMWLSKKTVSMYEGCGSVAFDAEKGAQIFGPVKRPASLIIEATDERGEKFELKADGFLARVIQHEMDHLQGTTFIEHVENPRKLMSREEYRKMMTNS